MGTVSEVPASSAPPGCPKVLRELITLYHTLPGLPTVLRYNRGPLLSSTHTSLQFHLQGKPDIFLQLCSHKISLLSNICFAGLILQKISIYCLPLFPKDLMSLYFRNPILPFPSYLQWTHFMCHLISSQLSFTVAVAVVISGSLMPCDLGVLGY